MWLVAIFFAALELPALACASCGSGGAIPIVLYPGQKSKVYSGFSLSGGFEEIKADGKEGSLNGADRRGTLTFAGAIALHEDLAFLISGAHVTNFQRGGRSQQGMGDPSIALHWRALGASFDRPTIPQIKILAAYKPDVASSIYETEDANVLDVFGNGFRETQLGFDLWWGMSKLKAGLAVMAVHSLERKADERLIERGLAAATTVAVGGNLSPSMLVTSGLVHQEKMNDQMDGQPIANSESHQTDGFVSTRLDLATDQEVRLSVTRTGMAVLSGKNGTRSIGATAGYSRVF